MSYYPDGASNYVDRYWSDEHDDDEIVDTEDDYRDSYDDYLIDRYDP